MQKYSLRFDGKGPAGPQEVTFAAESVQEALEVAKSYTIAGWAELYEDGVAMCRIQLMDDGGVWRVTSLNPRQ